MFCKRCGLGLEEGARFCRACGQEVPIAAAVTPGAQDHVAPTPMSMGATVRAPLAYAGFWVRASAYTIDGIILGIPFSLLAVVLIFFLGGFGAMIRRSPVDPTGPPGLGGAAILSFMFAMALFVGLQWLYFAAMESSARQATFGKSLLSLRVTNLEGRRLSFAHATGRFFAKLISGLIPFGLGYLMAGFTAKKQALHDMIAGTLVLRE